MAALSKNFGSVPATQAEIGRLLLTRGNQTAARAAFDRALAKDPLQLSALEGITVLDLQEKKTASRTRTHRCGGRGGTEKRSGSGAGTGGTDVRLDAGPGRRRASIETGDGGDPGHLAAYDLLARIYVEQKKLPQALTEFENLVAAPADARSDRTRRSPSCCRCREKPTRRSRGTKRCSRSIRTRAIAANNLARSTPIATKKLDIALQLAQVAKSAMPNDPDVDDTLGWVYYKKNLSGLAIEAFKRSVASDPNNPNQPIYLYHLGLAYMQAGNRSLARQTLEKALSLKSDFQGADDARKELQKLRG